MLLQGQIIIEIDRFDMNRQTVEVCIPELVWNETRQDETGGHWPNCRDRDETTYVWSCHLGQFRKNMGKIRDRGGLLSTTQEILEWSHTETLCHHFWSQHKLSVTLCLCHCIEQAEQSDKKIKVITEIPCVLYFQTSGVFKWQKSLTNL